MKIRVSASDPVRRARSARLRAAGARLLPCNGACAGLALLMVLAALAWPVASVAQERPPELPAIGEASSNAADPALDPRTARLRTLLAQPEEERDDAWTDRFYEIVAEAPLFVTSLEPGLGPDGFPYLAFFTSTESDSVAVVSIDEMLPQLTEVGVGVVLDPREGSVGWVFHYGDLVCRRLYGRFEVAGSSPVDPVAPGATPTEVETAQGEVLAAPPSHSYLPDYVRAVLRNFFQSALGVQEPAVVLLRRGGDTASPELAFNIFAEGFEQPEQMQALLLDLTWFLPRHYYITALSRKALPKESFVRL